MKNQSKSIIMVFLCSIILAQVAFISLPGARAFSLQDFNVNPNPSSMPLLVGHSYEFTLTATLPGGSGSNGVDVYVLPQAGQIGTTGIMISYIDAGYGINPLHIPANSNTAKVKMSITIPSEVTPGPLPLTVTAYDNPGSGGTIIGSFTVTLHVNQIPLIVQTNGLDAPTNVYLNGAKVGTALDSAAFGPMWLQLNPATGTVNTGSIGVDDKVSGNVQYFFSSWADSTANPHPSITTSEPVTLTANYVTKTSQITITSNPTGTDFINVDGETYNSPHTFSWAVGSTHNLQAFSQVTGTSGIQYVYANWTDYGEQSHSYTVSSTIPATVTANYDTQYSISLDANPTDAGTTNPSSGAIFWLSSGELSIDCSANAGYHFDHWSSTTDSITFASLTEPSTTAIINAPGIITANFAFNSVTHFIIEAPSSATAGTSFPATITALDATNNIIIGYNGAVHITSSDGQSVLPADAKLTNGIGTFTIILKTAGIQTISATDTETSSITGTSNDIHVTANSSSPGYIIISPLSSEISAGQSKAFTAELFDVYGNTLGFITEKVSWSIDTNAGGSWQQTTGTYTSAIASPSGSSWTVTASLNDLTGHAALRVTHATDKEYLSFITASVNPKTVPAPNTATGTAIAHDIFGNSWDISSLAVWSIPDGNDGGSWVGNIYTSHAAGTFTIKAVYESMTAEASLTVTHATDMTYLDHIAIDPKESTVNAGVAQTYTTKAYDIFGNNWTADSAYTSSNPNIVVSGNSAYSNTAGTYLIRAAYEGKSDTATLTVSGHLQTMIAISVTPKAASIPAGSQEIFTAVASDGYNNWEVTNQANWSIVEAADGGSWNQTTGTYTSAKAGIWTIKATLGVLSDTATLTVQANAQQLDHITITPKATTLTAGASQSYNTEAFDIYGNSLGTVTSSTLFSTPGAGVSGNKITPPSAGQYTVTGTYNGKTDSATLTVTAIATTKQSTTYTFTLIEKGLPLGTAWTATFNGQTKSSNTQTIIFTGIKAGDYSLSVNNTIDEIETTRYVTNSTSKIAIHVTTSTAVEINYKAQYYLTVDSPYGNPTGAGWYDAGAKAQFNITSPVTDNSGTHAFTSWKGTGNNSYTGNDKAQTVTMTGPIIETANWELASSLYSLLLVALIIFMLLLLAAFLAWRRRKKKQNANAKA